MARKKEEWVAKKAARKGGDGKEGGEGKGTKRAREGDEEKEKKEPFKRDVIPDMIIKVSKLGEGVLREDIKEAFEGAGANVQFVEFNRGNEIGYVRSVRCSCLKLPPSLFFLPFLVFDQT